MPNKDSEQQERSTPLLFDENSPATTITYTYDGLYRLTDAVYSNGFVLRGVWHLPGADIGARLNTMCGGISSA